VIRELIPDMKRKSNPSIDVTPLRNRAETRLRQRLANGRTEAGETKSAADTQRLLHELQVHQIELEMQNEELQKARDEMEVGLAKYSELYDFAPVGYFTLSREGDIRESNLTGASLLRIARGALVAQRLGSFVSRPDRPVFDAFLRQVFASPVMAECDVRLLLEGKTSMDVRMRANLSDSGQTCQVAVTDITKHKLAEEVTARLAAIVTSSSDAIIGEDLSSIITSWNAGAEKIFGYSASEMVGSSILRLIPPDRQHEDALIMSRIRKGESVEHYETVRQTKEGRLLDMAVTVSPIRYVGGRIIGASKVARDITEQKLSGEKVRVSEVRYRRLFEAAHDGVLLLDPGSRKITDANPFMTKLLGYPRDRLVGKELFEIGLLKDEAASQEIFRRLKLKHEVRYEDLPLKSQMGRHQEVEVVANLYEENGHSVIQCNIRDITARKLAEDLLRRSEALFSALIAQAPVGVYVVDAMFKLQQVNPRALPIFNKIKPLNGRDFSEVIHILWSRPVADQVVKRFRHTLKTGVPYRSPEFAERRRDLGVKEIYDWQIQRVTLPAGEYGVVCFFDDITERKRAETAQRRLAVLTASNKRLGKEIIRRQAVESALRQSELRARQLLKESQNMHEKLRQFSHQILQVQEDQRREISHELHDRVCQLLVGINVHLANFVNAAASHPKGIRRTIAPMRQLVEKSLQIVHRFARELRPASLDDLGLIAALRAYISEFPKKEGRQIQFAAFAGVEAMENDKLTVLYRVVQEALTNVDRHAQASVVKVAIFKAPDGVCLEIADNGKAFDVGHLVFGRSGKRLGLIGMRERVEMVGGRFSVASTPGKGTTIRAEIPFEEKILPRSIQFPVVRIANPSSDRGVGVQLRGPRVLNAKVKNAATPSKVNATT